MNANHLRSTSEGMVMEICSPIHIGKKHIHWDINPYNDAEKTTCISRLSTVMTPNLKNQLNFLSV